MSSRYCHSSSAADECGVYRVLVELMMSQCRHTAMALWFRYRQLSHLPLHRLYSIRAVTSSPSLSRVSDAVEIVDARSTCSASPAVVLTCEHASERFLSDIASSTDRALFGSHWAVDIGADALTRALCARICGVSVLSRVSRLVVDVNRPLHSETLFRTVADGVSVSFNRDMSAEERARRITSYYDPYHCAVDDVVKTIRPDIALSLHSFTPLYEGARRDMECGVLYNRETDAAFAQRVCERLVSAGIAAILNAPWSGRDGFMFALDRAAQVTPIKSCIMIEVRNDTALDQTKSAIIVETLAAAAAMAR